MRRHKSVDLWSRARVTGIRIQLGEARAAYHCIAKHSETSNLKPVDLQLYDRTDTIHSRKCYLLHMIHLYKYRTAVRAYREIVEDEVNKEFLG